MERVAISMSESAARDPGLELIHIFSWNNTLRDVLFGAIEKYSMSRQIVDFRYFGMEGV